MKTKDILSELTAIFTNILDTNDINLTEETTANDIEEWDSLNNIQLVVAIERHFKIRFTSAEIQSWKNVGEMCITIQQKATAR